MSSSNQKVDCLPPDCKLYAASKRINQAALRKVKELVHAATLHENSYNEIHLVFYFKSATMVDRAHVLEEETKPRSQQLFSESNPISDEATITSSRCNRNPSNLNHLKIPTSIYEGYCGVFPRPNPKERVSIQANALC